MLLAEKDQLYFWALCGPCKSAEKNEKDITSQRDWCCALFLEDVFISLFLTWTYKLFLPRDNQNTVFQFTSHCCSWVIADVSGSTSLLQRRNRCLALCIWSSGISHTHVNINRGKNCLLCGKTMLLQPLFQVLLILPWSAGCWLPGRAPRLFKESSYFWQTLKLNTTISRIN